MVSGHRLGMITTQSPDPSKHDYILVNHSNQYDYILINYFLGG